MTNDIQFGTCIPARDMHWYAEWCRAAEGFGYDWLGYGDSGTLWIDPYVALTVAALNTRRVRLGTLITNPVTRHPSATASALCGVQQISGGRLVCGIGTGDSAMHNLGLKAATRDTLAEYCRTVRALCNGEEVEYRGHKLRMQFGPHPVPIWMAAEGPKMLDLAGRMADGVIIGCGLTDEVIADCIRRVHAGAKAAGRNPDDIELWWLAKPHFSATEEAGWAELRFSLAGTANHHFRTALEEKFIPPRFMEPLKKLHQEYNSAFHADFRNPGPNAALVEKYGLTEFLGRRFSICGSAERIAERLHEGAKLGAKNLILIQLVADHVAAMRKLSTEIFPAFGKGAGKR